MIHKLTTEQEEFLYTLCSFYIDGYDVDDSKTHWRKENYYFCIEVITDGYYSDELIGKLNAYRDFYIYTKKYKISEKTFGRTK